MFYLFCIVFVVLNVLDFTITMWLMRMCGSNIEGNPFGAFCYKYGGWAGIAFLKGIMMLLVLSIVCYIKWWRRKSTHAYLILVLGCIILGTTVIYSLTLTDKVHLITPLW